MPTQLAVVGPLVWRAGWWRGIWGAWWHEALASTEVAILALLAAIAALLVGHVAVPAIFGGRSQRIISLSYARPTRLLQAHVLDAGGSALHAQVSQLGFKVLDIAAAVFDLSVQTREHSRVVGRLAHGIGGVDQGALPVNLALHIGNGLVDVGHGGGGSGGGSGSSSVAQQRRRGGRGLRLSADGCGEGEEVPGGGRRGCRCSVPKQAPDVQWDAVRGRSRVVERWAKDMGSVAVVRMLGAR